MYSLIKRYLKVSVVACLCLVPTIGAAAPYAAVVMDARSGEILHSRNAKTQLHPASLTKMMTLYIVFEAIRLGEITLDTMVKVSSNAAAEPPIKLGLRRGQQIELRYLVRATAVRSSNDAATAIAEAISGSEAEFARRMTRTAKALGMHSTTFKNAHGLTQAGHLSTATDMTTMGRRLFFDYPEYYNLFSRRTADTTMMTVKNTNRKLLNNYQGADGIKTGYTRAAGYNLVASAQRGEVRIIATVFGGKSGAWRNRRVAELLDMGFDRASPRVATIKPPLPGYAAERQLAKSIRPSVRPLTRSQTQSQSRSVSAPENSEILRTLTQVTQTQAPPNQGAAGSQAVSSAVPKPGTKAAPEQIRPPVLAANPDALERAVLASAATDQTVIVTKLRDGETDWGINLGRFASVLEAEKQMLQLALSELHALEGGQRRVARNSSGFEATFVGLSRRQADLACRRLSIRQVSCQVISGVGTG